VVPLVTSNIDGRLFAVVNVNTFDPEPALTFDCASTNFDGEDADSRLARRKRTWISKVRVFGDVGDGFERTHG
jgi:bifunctional pyridoxal-dependent enzyme with beta-cystathionase and maltose regulon repressor activities